MQKEILVSPVWAYFYEEAHIPAAIRTGNTIVVSGHTGETLDQEFPSDVGEQIRGTFVNIASTLAEAGATWADVVEIRSFHVHYHEQSDLVMEIAAEFLTDPYPAWTAVGVTELYDHEAVIEIAVTAVVD